MILPRTDSIKPPSALDQKGMLSRLTKGELEEVHTASTHYPHQDHGDADIQRSLDHPSPSLDNDRSIVSTATAMVAPSKESGDLKIEGSDVGNALQVKEALLQQQASDSSSSVASLKQAIVSEENQWLQNTPIASPVSTIITESLPQKGELVLPESDSVFIKSSTKKEDEGTLLSRLGAAVASVLPALNNKITTDHAAPALGENQAGINALKKATLVSAVPQESLLDDGVADSLDLGEQLDDVSSHDQQGEGESVKNLEVREKITSAQDAGDNTDFTGTQHERAHEVTHKMAESEESNPTMARPVIARAEIAPVVGSASSSSANLSESVAAALRVTHLLDELTAAVSRLRLDSSDGKEMTIQLRRDVLPETNIHIVSTSKQMEVSFFTSSASSNLLLNTHLTTLQSHLNSLCPGQVVNIQTQLTPSSGSSQMGTEQDHSRDDLASFDQGNRGNSNNDNDTL